jgi:hypothetical protein
MPLPPKSGKSSVPSLRIFTDPESTPLGMSSHIPAARLFKAVDGVALESQDITHIQDCAECRKVLELMARRGTHIGIVHLWKYANGLEMDDEDYDHLTTCETCLSALWLIRSGRSIDDVVQALRAA